METQKLTHDDIDSESEFEQRFSSRDHSLASPPEYRGSAHRAITVNEAHPVRLPQYVRGYEFVKGHHRYPCGKERCSRICGCIPVTGPSADTPANLCVWSFIIIPSIMFFTFAGPRLWNISPALPILCIVCCIITVTLLIFTQFTDPGIIPRSSIPVLPSGDLPRSRAAPPTATPYSHSPRPLAAPPTPPSPSFPSLSPPLSPPSYNSLASGTAKPPLAAPASTLSHSHPPNHSSALTSLPSPTSPTSPAPDGTLFSHGVAAQAATHATHAPADPMSLRATDPHARTGAGTAVDVGMDADARASAGAGALERPVVQLPAQLAHPVDGYDMTWRWCHTCCIYKPPRTAHCRSCGTCIKEFDHHCPFVGNCVGQRNYFFFLAFLASVMLYIVVVLMCTFLLLSSDSSDNDRAKLAALIVLGIIGGTVFILLCMLAGMHIYLMIVGKTTKELLGKKTDVSDPLRDANPFLRFINEDLVRGANGEVTEGRTYLLNRPASLLTKKIHIG